MNFNPLTAHPRKWSNTLKQFVGCCRRVVWVCLTVLRGWRFKGSVFSGVLAMCSYLKKNCLKFIKNFLKNTGRGCWNELEKENTIFDVRSSHEYLNWKIAVLKNLINVRGEQPCWIPCLMNLQISSQQPYWKKESASVCYQGVLWK